MWIIEGACGCMKKGESIKSCKKKIEIFISYVRLCDFLFTFTFLYNWSQKLLIILFFPRFINFIFFLPVHFTGNFYIFDEYLHFAETSWTPDELWWLTDYIPARSRLHAVDSSHLFDDSWVKAKALRSQLAVAARQLIIYSYIYSYIVYPKYFAKKLGNCEKSNIKLAVRK